MQVKYCLWLNKPLSGLRHAGGRALEVGTPSDWNVSGKRRRWKQLTMLYRNLETGLWVYRVVTHRSNDVNQRWSLTY